MARTGRTASTAGAGASRSSSSSTGSSSSSTSSGSSSASTSSSSKGSTSSSGAGASRSSRSSGSSSSSVSVSSPSASKTVTTTKTTTPSTTTAPAKTTTTTTATPKTAIPVSTDLARAITESQAKYPDAWEKATGTTNIQQQFEQITGTTIPVIEQEQEIEEQFIPEILPEVFAEEQEQVLADDIQQILNDIDAELVHVPDWFHNNIEWVKSGHITEQEFRTAYNYLIDAQIVHVAEPTTNETITNDMITQHLDYFTIENGRAKGQITFTLNANFNPFYYGKDIVNIIQFKTKAGANILPFVKENRLRFTESERDEIIQYDEDMQGNTMADLESFVWLGTTTPTAFSSVLRSEIKEGQAATTTSEGFMAAGITGAIALLIGIGLILPDRVRRKR
tara:strand:+ start:5452 stop:6633 length:1182 start_codon:yes stop_codon:yes gene_type:complete